MDTQNKFLFCDMNKNHYMKQKQVPSKVYSVRCVGCVECEGVTKYAPRQRGTQWEGSNNAPTLADNSFDGVECTATVLALGGWRALIISVTASLFGVKLVQAVWREREELLIEDFGR